MVPEVEINEIYDSKIDLEAIWGAKHGAKIGPESASRTIKQQKAKVFKKHMFFNLSL